MVLYSAYKGVNKITEIIRERRAAGHVDEPTHDAHREGEQPMQQPQQQQQRPDAGAQGRVETQQQRTAGEAEVMVIDERQTLRPAGTQLPQGAGADIRESQRPERSQDIEPELNEGEEDGDPSRRKEDVGK